MSEGGDQIVCRKCQKVFPVQDGACPKCGTELRDDRKMYAVAAVGLLLAGLSLVGLDEPWSFVILGLLIAAGGYYGVYSKRQNIEKASERDGSGAQTTE